MTRLAILDSTLKKLFALSGNQCTFPGCNQILVNDNGDLLVDICHIEAANIEGERYNPNQTDEERRAFENLILLCPTHHRETDNEAMYTVTKLKEMKANHENRFKDNEYDVSEEIITKIQEKLTLSQENYNYGGNQYNTQNAPIIVNNGLSYCETKDLFETLFEQNFPKLKAEAMKTAELRVKIFEELFFKLAAKVLTEEEFQNFIDPDIQYVCNKAVETVARRQNEKGINDILTNLIISRIKNNKDNIKKIIDNESIFTVKKLTNKHLNLLTLIYLLKHQNFQDLDNPKVLEDYLNNYIELFLTDLLKDATLTDIYYLEYASCGTQIRLFPSTFQSTFGKYKIFKDKQEKVIEDEFSNISEVGKHLIILNNALGLMQFRLSPIGMNLGKLNFDIYKL